MSILIKSMEMPKNCAECFARELAGAGAGVSFCRITEGQLDFDYDELRMEFCPIVPVPPHGRLIDADALMKHKGKCYDADGHLLYAVGTGNILHAPTIIPASEEGE